VVFRIYGLFQHKVLAIVEAEGAAQAACSLNLLQREGAL
jgi:hypothetical protein